MTARSFIYAAAVVGVAAACSSGGGYTTGTNMNPGGGNGAGGSAILAQDFAFAPANLTVKAGTTVTWSNVGAATHHPVADSGSFDVGDLAPAVTGTYGTGTGTGGTGSFTFAMAGTFTYHCSIHPQMTGTVTVTP